MPDKFSENMYRHLDNIKAIQYQLQGLSRSFGHIGNSKMEEVLYDAGITLYESTEKIIQEMNNESSRLFKQSEEHSLTILKSALAEIDLTKQK